MDLEGIILSEMSDKEKYRISHLYVKTNNIIVINTETEWQLPGAIGGENDDM